MKVTYVRRINLRLNKVHDIGTVNFKHKYILNKQCQCQSRDYWADDTLGS